MKTFIDLFCGIGGFRVALERKGLECVFSSDIDKDVRKAYCENFGETPEGDITEISAKRIPKHDILCAGFPCQSFSVAGNRKGTEDPRGKLFEHVIRIAKHHKPSVILLENVRNILKVGGGNDFKKIVKALEACGYLVKAMLLNSADFGIPQARHRVYFACVRKACGVKTSSVQNKVNPKPLKNALEAEVDKSLYIPENYKPILYFDKQEKDLTKPWRVGHYGKCGMGQRIYSPENVSITIKANGGGWGAKTGLYFDGKGIRRLDITESKRVMGFSDTHVVSEGNQGYKQLGNAVIPKMIETVFDSLIF